MKINESNFIEELKNENHKALDYIYSKYVGLVYKVVLDVLKNKATNEDIEECVSDIFIGVWKNSSKFNENITTFNKWLIAVSKYKAIDYLRKVNKAHGTVELNEDITLSKDNIEDKFINKDNVSTVYQLIENMSTVDKKIFIKRYILNEDISGIAKDLDVTRGVIDNRLSRGRKVIREKWQQLMGGN
ncbi:MAG: sigma-70 family RNA polymerase sigma factor [Clostridiaceae bacterium]